MRAPATFAPRIERLRGVMQAHRCDAMLVDHAELLAWATGYTVSQTMYRAAVIPLSGEPCFVLRSLDAGPCRDGVWFSDIVAFADDADPYVVVAEAMQARGFAASRIGVDFTSYGFTADAQRRLALLLPEAAFVDLGPVNDAVRACKFSDEIALIEAAAGIADATMSELEAAVRPGQRVRDVAAIAASAFLRLGADEGGPGPILRGSGDIDFLHGHGLDAVLGAGDILHVELTPRVRNYSARLMRPIFLGRPPAAQAEAFARLTALQEVQIAAMQPGATAREVDAILRDGVLREGLRADFANVTGYMLGLYGRTPRSSDFSHAFHPGAAFTLQPGMVFHMYASAQGVAISETVLVSASGPRRLTRCPRRAMRAPAGDGVDATD
ncbi:M24 family metallopeptidase [Limobrevibacterium gyesilva]|uniref:Xaa-Pro peptidase family protein n=1 Tax=Limobrevibacterium gyesilva TaxID=2991712 RepID=A0AA41YVC2_9PROT|nr:Xaa-Pro peptidase family protein [Limobrevibacterium gyesilva]MCW3476067.1 Xaa-Pro peptidase family protein [Limobrevibacterium gyesilva]